MDSMAVLLKPFGDFVGLIVCKGEDVFAPHFHKSFSCYAFLKKYIKRSDWDEKIILQEK